MVLTYGKLPPPATSTLLITVLIPCNLFQTSQKALSLISCERRLYGMMSMMVDDCFCNF